MATIVGAVATSHTPTIGFALDTHKQADPVWAPIFEGYQPVRQWMAEKKPDVLFFIYNDHITSFFFDHYSHFALGVGDSYPVADEGRSFFVVSDMGFLLCDGEFQRLLDKPFDFFSHCFCIGV